MRLPPAGHGTGTGAALGEITKARAITSGIQAEPMPHDRDMTATMDGIRFHPVTRQRVALPHKLR